MWIFSRPKRGWIPAYDPKIQRDVINHLKGSGFSLSTFRVDVEDYKEYLKQADYPQYIPYYNYILSNFAEKTLEHYLAMKLLSLNKYDTYIDIANAESPTPEIYHEITGCNAYRQDLIFTTNIEGKRIGGDAARMPVGDAFADKMALHCSFEHFEEDSDSRFIWEASRVLKPGGKLCILPLYLFIEYAIQTDPKAHPGLTIEKAAVLYHAVGWGERHGRFYDVSHLVSRITNNLNGMRMMIYVIENEKEIDPSCYVKFAALIEKNIE
jgi:hypothetical protein